MSVETKFKTLTKAFGDEERLEHALDLLLQYKLEEERRRLTEYERDLKEFEEKYQMDTETMDAKFESGELGDAMDFFEWSGLYAVYKSLQSKIEGIEQNQ